jgi:hypothetical protein
VKLTTHPFISEVRIAWSYSSNPQYAIMAWHSTKHRNNLKVAKSLSIGYTVDLYSEDAHFETRHGRQLS